MPTSMKTYFSILAFWLTLLFPLSAQSGKIDPQQKQQPHKIYWSQVRHQDGRKITVNRVAPPEPVQIAPTESLPENDEQAQRDMEQFIAEYGGSFLITATIYDHRLTKVKWQHDGEKFEAVSNIDFNHLNSITSFKTRGKNYSFMLLAVNAPLTDLKRQASAETDLASYQKLKGLEPSYTVTKGDLNDEAAMEFIEAIHDLYAAEQPRLIAAYEARLRNEKIRAEQLAELRENPPPKPDLTINFWKRDVVRERQEKAAQQKGEQR